MDLGWAQRASWSPLEVGWDENDLLVQDWAGCIVVLEGSRRASQKSRVEEAAEPRQLL